MSLNQGLTDVEIKLFTGISQRTMKQLQKIFRETAEVARVPVCAGRPRLNESAWAITGSTLVRVDNLLITRISAGDIVNVVLLSSSSESSPEDVSGTRSGGRETVVSERVFEGKVERARRDSAVMIEAVSIMIHEDAARHE